MLNGERGTAYFTFLWIAEAIKAIEWANECGRGAVITKELPDVMRKQTISQAVYCNCTTSQNGDFYKEIMDLDTTDVIITGEHNNVCHSGDMTIVKDGNLRFAVINCRSALTDRNRAKMVGLMNTIAKFAHTHKCSVIGLTELDVPNEETKKELEHQVESYGYKCVSANTTTGGAGAAILFRGSISHDHKGFGASGRVSHVRLWLSGGPVFVMCIYGATGGTQPSSYVTDSFKKKHDDVMRYVNTQHSSVQRREDHIIVLTDANSHCDGNDIGNTANEVVPEGLAMKLTIELQYVDTLRRLHPTTRCHTYTGNPRSGQPAPVSRLDYIFISPEMISGHNPYQLTESAVYAERISGTTLDHYPVICDSSIHPMKSTCSLGCLTGEEDT